MKKTIKIWGCTPFVRRYMWVFHKPLEDKFDFVETKESPDFVFVHAADRQILLHSGIRIFITGENVIPDFNIVDYAVGFSDIAFGDRYIRWPLYRWPYTLAEFEGKRLQSLQVSSPSARTKNCACVVSNVSNRQGPFVEMVDALERYKGVTYGGKWRNNIGGRVKDKEALLREHKFSIAFENAAYSGYTTEKITEAFMAGTIPIYWGDPDVVRHFNSKAFIAFNSSDTVDTVMARIQAIDTSQELYESMLREPIFTEQANIDLEQRRIIDFFDHIFSQPPEIACRRNKSRWGIKYEIMLQRTFFNPFFQLLRLSKMLWGDSLK